MCFLSTPKKRFKLCCFCLLTHTTITIMQCDTNIVFNICMYLLVRFATRSLFLSTEFVKTFTKTSNIQCCKGNTRFHIKSFSDKQIQLVILTKNNVTLIHITCRLKVNAVLAYLIISNNKLRLFERPGFFTAYTI